MDSQQQDLFLLDSLYCEEHWVEKDEERDLEEEESENIKNNNNRTNPSLLPLFLLEQDMFWEDEELVSLLSKEEETHFLIINLDTDPSVVVARREAVEWMLRVNAHYAFSVLTAVLSVNYFHRFLSRFNFQREKPWTTQLVAVACLSLAAKVEETQVPLLLDLQVEETKYVFEAKTIQRMELLVLSRLHWKMNPVTPLSFLDHIVRRLGLKSQLHWDFFKRCERIILSVVADSRFVRYLPSLLATATMLHVVDQIEPFNSIEYQNQLISIFKISKERIDQCYQLIRELNLNDNAHSHSYKRNYESIPSSPNGIIDVSFSSNSSNDSSTVGSSVSSSLEPLLKKRRGQQDQKMRLPSLNRVFVDVLNSPR